MVIIVATNTEEIKEAFVWLTENVNAVNVGEIVTEKRPMTGAERTAKWRAGKKAQQGDVSVTSQPSQGSKEKREEKEESFSPSSPSSLPSFPPDPLINYPITPIIPSSQEEKGERKESFVAAAAANTEDAITPEQPLSFGNFVRLKNSEYDKLVAKFGVVRVDEMIQRMDNYIGEDPKRQKKYETRNHYLTLLNWERMDQERKTQPLMQKPQPEQPRRKSWAELGREMDARERGEVIDL